MFYFRLKAGRISMEGCCVIDLQRDVAVFKVSNCVTVWDLSRLLSE